MPIIYRCKSCGSVLYVFERVGQDAFGVPTPDELARRYGGRCPFCGRILNRAAKPEDIRIAG